MRSLVYLISFYVIPLLYGQENSSRIYRQSEFIDYVGDDTTQAFFWNGTIARCPIPSTLFNTLDSVTSEVIVLIMYMPMKFEENGELNKKTLWETIQNIKGGEEEMYFLGFDLLNKKLDVYTCDDYIMCIPIKTYRKGSNKLIFKTEDDRFLGSYEIHTNKDKRIICNVYNKREDKSEILYSTKSELVQILK